MTNALLGQTRVFNIRNVLSYFHLLCSAGVEKIDVGLLVVGVLAAIAAGIPFPILGILFGQLVDDLNSNSCEAAKTSNSAEMTSKVLQKVLIMIYLSVANFFAIFIYAFCFSSFGERLVGRLRLRYFRNVLRQEMSFHDTLSYGEMSNHLTLSMDTIRSGTSEKVGSFVSSVAYLVGAFAVAFLQVPRLAGMLTFLIPAYTLLVILGGKYISRFSSSTSSYLGAAATIVSQSLQHVSLVQAFEASDRLESRLSSLVINAQKEAIKKTLAASIQFGGMFLLAYSANALAFWQGSKMIAAASQSPGKVTAGSVYTVIFVLLDASFVVSQVAPLVQVFGAATAAARTMREIADRRSQIDGTAEEKRSATFANSTVTFEKVSFAYPSRPDMPILEHVDLQIQTGQHTAIVGSSGSGKSTIAGLIARLYDPTEGQILINGRHLRSISTSSWRSSIGIVDQEPMLFACSLLENIAFGLLAARDVDSASDMLEDKDLARLLCLIENGCSLDSLTANSPDLAEFYTTVRRAAKQAQADDFIQALPHGYATMIGSIGSQLSGGQKQRIALARALIRDPDILILDEATSALDSATEQDVQKSLQSARRGRTTVTIAHRLATIKEADRIIVFNDGMIGEQGTHAELIAREGIYAGMIKAQAVVVKETIGNSASSSSTSASDPKFMKNTSTTAGDSFTGDSSPLTPLTSTKSASRRLAFTEILVTFAKLAKPYSLPVLVGILSTIIAGGAYSGDAVIFGHTIGHLQSCQGEAAILSVGTLAGGLFFMVAFVSFLANVFAGYGLGSTAEKVVSQARVSTYRALMRQDMSWYVSDGRSPATLLTYFTADTASLAGLSGTVLGTILTVVANLVASLLLTFIIAWKIAIVLLATIPVLLGSGFMRLRAVARFQLTHQELYADSAELTLDAISSIKTVALLGLEKVIFERYRRSLSTPYKKSLREMVYMNVWLAAAYSVSPLMYALAYWWGSRLVAAGEYSQAQFFIVLPALLFSAQSCGQTLALAPDLSNARLAAARLAGLLGDEVRNDPNRDSYSRTPCAASGDKEKDDIEKRENPPLTGMSVFLRDLRFRHPNRPMVPVLQGLDMTIPPGELCALIGPSGAGKSTVLSLLEQFHAPDDGIIELDGQRVNPKSSDPARRTLHHRSEMAFVPQENVLFEETIRFNISLGARPGHDPKDSEIEEACHLAGIHDFIMTLPEGYMTVGGARFSGGQKQRLCIARALVRRPRLLLMDEPTSALDTESERQLQKTIERIRGSMTILIVAHRLHTIQHADRIFMLEDGRCAAFGTHLELMATSEAYKANVLHQSLAC